MGSLLSHCCMLYFPEEPDNNIEILIKHYNDTNNNEFVTKTIYTSNDLK